MSEQRVAPVVDAGAPAVPGTGDRLRTAARRARSLWCAIMSGLA